MFAISITLHVDEPLFGITVEHDGTKPEEATVMQKFHLVDVTWRMTNRLFSGREMFARRERPPSAYIVIWTSEYAYNNKSTTKSGVCLSQKVLFLPTIQKTVAAKSILDRALRDLAANLHTLFSEGIVEALVHCRGCVVEEIQALSSALCAPWSPIVHHD